MNETSQHHAKSQPPGSTRRRFLFGGGVAVVAAGAFAARWYNISAETGATALNVADAYAAAQGGEIVLVDVRRPDDWARTGVGQGAVPIDMRRPDFVAAVSEALSGDRSRPVALICARGVRSRRMSEALADAGFTQVLDVPEGMLGSGAGPGWLRSGLPVARVD